MKKNKKNKVGQLNISEKLFVKIIGSLEKQSAHDQKCSDAMDFIYPDGSLMAYNNQALEERLMLLLKQAMNDNDDKSWIDYFCYDLGFGANFKAGCVTSSDNEEIDLSTPEALYNFLKSL